MSVVWRDLHQGWRWLARNPGFTGVALAALALGIGANSALFTVLNAVLLQPLPFPRAQELVRVWSTNTARSQININASFLDVQDWRAQSHAFRDLGAIYLSGFTVTGSGNPELLQAGRVSSSLLRSLEVPPALGRLWTGEQEVFGQHQVVLLSHGLWLRRFGGRQDVVGQQVLLEDVPYTIVGVMPSGFRFPDAQTSIWVPLAWPAGDPWADRARHYLKVVGRLNPGVSLAQAESELRAVAAQLAATHLEDAGLSVRLVSLEREAEGDLRTPLLLLAGASAGLLLIACVNVANLLLARAASRQKEIAIRLALGATRARLIAQLITEGVLLAGIAAAVGLALAAAAIRLLTAVAPPELPQLRTLPLDARVLLFTLGLSVLTGVLFSLVPAFGAVRMSVAPALQDGGKGETNTAVAAPAQTLLVVTEIAAAVVLLAGAGLLLRSLWTLRGQDPGFQEQQSLAASVILSPKRTTDAQQVVADLDPVLHRLSGLPGVRVVGVTSSLPLAGMGRFGYHVSVEGRAYSSRQEVPILRHAQASSDAFQALGVPLRQGRYFQPQDRADDGGVAIINEAAARWLWPQGGALGSRLRLGFPEALRTAKDQPGALLTVVGIVGDTRQNRLDQPAEAELYTPIAGAAEPRAALAFVLHGDGNVSRLVTPVRRELKFIPGASVGTVTTLDVVLDRAVSSARFPALLMGWFAALALLLAAIGTYGVMAYLTSLRRREIAIRLAVGAMPSDISRMILWGGLRVSAAGILLGLAGTWVASRWMASALYGVSPQDAATLAVVAGVMAVVCVVASLLPAWRATRVLLSSVLR